MTHVNSPKMGPDFAASPDRLGWPARSRRTVACMHRFSHILGWPPEPAVWLMSEWRAVAIEQARLYADLPIISSWGMETSPRVRDLKWRDHPGRGFRDEIRSSSIWISSTKPVQPFVLHNKFNEMWTSCLNGKTITPHLRNLAYMPEV